MFDDKTMAAIQQSILEKLGTDLLLNEGSYTGDLVAPVAYEMSKLYRSMGALLPIFYIDETSGPFIDLQCASFGITRKAGTKAVATATLYGTGGRVVPAGTEFETADGLRFVSKLGVILQGTEFGAEVELEAEQPGRDYNVDAGEIIRAVKSNAGVSSLVSLAASGGSDAESDEALVTRYYERLRRPPTSSNGYHYQQWAMEVPGVGAARVIGLWNGPGTVKVLLADAEMQPVGESIVEAAERNITEQVDIGPAVTVEAATAAPIDVTATLTLDSEANLAAVTAEFKLALSDYLKTLVQNKFHCYINAQIDTLADFGYSVVYNRIAQLLMDCEGVTDFTALTVNEGAGNVLIQADELPTLGEVVLS